MNYPLLALDAGPGRSFACLLLSQERAFYAESSGNREHSQSLMPMLEGLLSQGNISWRDLNMLALGIGPGSFTGLRIAAAAMAGINASLQLPVLAVSSLAVTAARAGCNDDLWVLEDARAGEMFIGHYQQALAMQDDRCARWDSLKNMAPSTYVSEAEPPLPLAGWKRLAFALGRSEALAAVIEQALPRRNPKALPKYLQPAYLQISQAEKTHAEKARQAKGAV